MKLRTLLVTVLVLLACATSVMAQSRVLAWDMQGVSSAAVAQGWTYAVTQNGTAVPAATVTCQAGTPVVCKRPVTLVTGINRFVVTVTGNGITVPSDQMSSEDPVKPTNLRLEIIVALKPDGSAEMLAFSAQKQ